jgi:hypothetical protein
MRIFALAALALLACAHVAPSDPKTGAIDPGDALRDVLDTIALVPFP